jgi:hypothetical protein
MSCRCYPSALILFIEFEELFVIFLSPLPYDVLNRLYAFESTEVLRIFSVGSYLAAYSVSLFCNDGVAGNKCELKPTGNV